MINIVSIIGFGSIGQKHLRILLENNLAKKIFIVSARKIKNSNPKVEFTSLLELLKIDPDYFIICSETSKHYEQLKFINKNFKNKKILVEKPLFMKDYKILKNYNKIFVGYNLRFHPVVQYVRKIIKNKKILTFDVICKTNLRMWRNRPYINASSASKDKGGGVLMDLSHEIDYLFYLLGNLIPIYSYNKKISNLKITSDDTLYSFGKTKKNTFFSMIFNYYSKINMRSFTISSNTQTIIGDFINKKVIYLKNGKKYTKEWKNFNLDETYINQHKSIIYDNNKNILCDFNQGRKILNIINNIKKS